MELGRALMVVGFVLVIVAAILRWPVRSSLWRPVVIAATLVFLVGSLMLLGG